MVDRLTKLRKPLFVLGILLNISLLFYYKYFDFTLESINNITGSTYELKNIILPIGISFFTFQGLSYLIDVYRKDVPVQYDISKIALYIVLFPQLIAGPIVRYTDVVKEIDQRSVQADDFCIGIERFIIGLSKKTLLANTMAITADTIWSNIGTNSVEIAWLGSIAYTLQIYFDFSGYSDMAIGLGRMFGFRFNENFNLPYISKSISEFWRRWHISLSSWFRDYIYIPLGGNRKHVYLNLAIVFLLTGIWHGANWTFILWGILNGVFMLLERFVNSKKKNVAKKQKCGIHTLFAHIYTLLVVNFGWVLFRAPDIKSAKIYLSTMCGLSTPDFSGYSIGWYLDKWTITILLFALLFASSFPGKIATLLKKYTNKRILLLFKYIGLIALLYLSMIRIVSGTYNPFIYFQF